MTWMKGLIGLVSVGLFLFCAWEFVQLQRYQARLRRQLEQPTKPPQRVD